MSNRPVRVRYAPSPTGPQHIGGIRTALYNYLFAKKNNGKIILRIEDTDQTRFVPSAEEYLLESVKWLGFEFDEGVHVGGDYAPYKQSERKHLYKKYADYLIGEGHAYYAFDTPEELEEMREKGKEAKNAVFQYNAITRSSMNNSLTLSGDETQEKLEKGGSYVIRLKMPENEEVSVKDIIRGRVVVNSDQLDDKIIFKSDGMSTYHLANVVDDHLMEISHVIRGEEWLPSAPFHVLLYKYLGWEDTMPEFAHLPLLLKPDGNGKLSKRDGDRLGIPVFPLNWNVPDSDEVYSGYREAGYFPEALINILAFLGWNPGTEQEVFSLDELIKEFSLERVGKSGAKFDVNKAKWYNQHYLKTTDNNKLGEQLRKELGDRASNVSTDFLSGIAGLMKERVVFLKDIIAEGNFFFNNPSEFDEKTVRKKWKENSAEIITGLKSRFEKIENFSSENIENTFKEYLEEKELGMGAVLPILRLLVTGKGMGPSMFEISSLLGKEEVIKRISENVLRFSEKEVK